MAVSMRSCWTLALSACLVLTVSADCGADCAYCIHHLQLQKTDINSLTCTLECEGALSPKKSWELCEDVLQARNADSSTEEDKATTETSKLDNNDPHQLVKKYGGFIKRYGGFMKKTAELYGPEPDDVDHGSEILFKRYGGFMKKSGEPEDTLSLLRELMRNVDGGDGGVEKRYGGFLRSARQSSDLENGIQELQKRYGGFMRRVGRPKWREEQKRYGGFLNKRAWGEEEEDEMEKERVELEDVPDVVEKRYGGFLGY